MNQLSSKTSTHQPAELDAKLSPHDIPGLYDSISGVYDLWAALTESKARQRALDLANVVNGQNILEVAVGTGLAFYDIVKRNPDGINIGVDISKGMLAKAKKRLSKLQTANYDLKIGNAFGLDEKDGKFDSLFNNYMFDLLPFKDMDTVITEFRRVLKPEGGKLVLVNMTIAQSTLNGIYQWIYSRSPRTLGGCRGVRLSEKLKAHGFRIITREYHQQCLFPSEVILATA